MNTKLKNVFKIENLAASSLVLFLMTFYYFKETSVSYSNVYDLFKKHFIDMFIFLISLLTTFILTLYYILKKTLRFNIGFLELFIKKDKVEQRYRMSGTIEILKKLEFSSYGFKSQEKLEIYRSIVGFEIGIIYCLVKLVYSEVFPNYKNLKRGNILNFENILLDTALLIYETQNNNLDKLMYNSSSDKKRKIKKFIMDEYREEKKEIQDNFIKKLYISVGDFVSPYEALVFYINAWESYIEDYMFLIKKWLERQNGRYEGLFYLANFQGQVFKETPNCTIGVEGEFGIGVVSWRLSKDIVEHRKIGKNILDMIKEYPNIKSLIFDCRKLGLMPKTILKYWIKDWLLLIKNENLKNIAIVYPRESFIKSNGLLNVSENLKINIGRFITSEQAFIWIVNRDTNAKDN